MVKPKSKNGKRRTTIYFDAMLWRKLKFLAFMNQTSASRLLEEAAKDYLKRNEAVFARGVGPQVSSKQLLMILT